jgi:hypothetical protein
MWRTFTLIGLFCSGQVLAAAPAHQVDQASGLHSWQWRDSQLSLTLNQRRPDQSRGFFQARGFSGEQAEPLARDCLFQATLRNQATSPTAITVDLGQWRVIAKDSPPRPPKLEQQWQPQWQQSGVSQAARLAFRWALFPTRQIFQPGDWNMGMITLGLTPGEGFDLVITWQEQDTPKSLRLTGLHCAPDQAP